MIDVAVKSIACGDRHLCSKCTEKASTVSYLYGCVFTLSHLYSDSRVVNEKKEFVVNGLVKNGTLNYFM